MAYAEPETSFISSYQHPFKLWPGFRGPALELSMIKHIFTARFAAGMLTIALCLGVPCGVSVEAVEESGWSQFRGPARDGISGDRGLADSWPEAGPGQLWRVEIGPGFSGVVLQGDTLFTMSSAGGGDEGRELAMAFDARTGKELWRREIGKTYFDEFGDGPRSTPTVAGEWVYFLGSYGDLRALKTGDGAEVWHVQVGEVFGSKPSMWGFSTSVLVDGDLLLVESGGAEGKAYAALNRATGNTRWTLGDGEPEHSYSSPILAHIPHRPSAAAREPHFVFTAGGLLQGVDRQGEMLWSHPWPVTMATHAMPVFVPPNRFFVSSVSSAAPPSLIAVHPDGDGYRTEVVWTSTQLKNHFSSSLYYEGSLFGFHNATFQVLDAATGEPRWGKRGFGKGSLILGDGKLFILSDRGKLVMADAGAERFEQLGSVQALNGKSWTAPTLVDGVIYLRNQAEMVAYRVKE